MGHRYLLRLCREDDKHAEDIKTLQSLVLAFGEAIDILEVGRRALTVELQSETTLPQLMDKTADIAELDEYEGLKVAPVRPSHLCLVPKNL